MKENNNNAYVLAIIGIVAIVGIIVMTFGTATTETATTTRDDASGMARAVVKIADPQPTKTYQECYSTCTDPPSCLNSDDCRRGCHMGCSQ